MILFFISTVVKYSATIAAVLAVVVGLVLFVTGAVATSILLLLILKMYIGNVYAKIGFSASRSSDRNTEVNLHVDSEVQRYQVSRESETLPERATITVDDTDSSDHGYAKDSTITNGITSSGGCENAQPAKDISSANEYNNGCSDIPTDNSCGDNYDYIL